VSKSRISQSEEISFPVEPESSLYWQKPEPDESSTKLNIL
jgi:hypothetical protein